MAQNMCSQTAIYAQLYYTKDCDFIMDYNKLPYCAINVL